MKFYVISERIAGEPWVLGDYPTVTKSQGAIRWQNDASGNWTICRRTGPDTFVAHDAPERSFTVVRGPYTVEAFEAFKAEWKA